MPSSPSDDPRSELLSRRSARLAEAAAHDARDRLVGNARVVTFLVGVALGWQARQGDLPGGLVLLPVAAFVALVVYHARVIAARRRAERAAAFHGRALSRLEGTWAGKGQTGERFLGPDVGVEAAAHPYAADLDVCGVGGLYELLCEARTAPGQETLAAWLLQSPAVPAPPPSPEVLRARQQAVRELAGRIELREELAVVADEVAAELGRERLARWVAAPSPPPLRWLSPLALAASLLSLVALLAWFGFDLGPRPFLVVAPVLWLTYRLARPSLEAITSALESRARELRLYAEVLSVVERQRFESPALVHLHAELSRSGRPASSEIARLAGLLRWYEQSRNQLLAPIAIALLVPLHAAFAIERWRRRTGPHVLAWLDALGSLEALCSLGGHAFLHPGDPFPELVEDEAVFVAEGLGHPLLPAERCVPNDVALGDPLRVLLVSGSNMSGKSTLLRAVGLAVVLGMAGAPVRARRLRLGRLSLGSTLRIEDSLHKGASRFYAEITRLRDVVARAAAAPPPLLFLLDELLSGTNSHDRRIGAAGILKGLCERGAIGLCTTHDLALADIVTQLGERAGNVHFEDHLDGDRIAFDYRLRPGVVTRSNAVGLMRAVGLPVDDSD